jgi:hypothetical protein
MNPNTVWVSGGTYLPVDLAVKEFEANILNYLLDPEDQAIRMLLRIVGTDAQYMDWAFSILKDHPSIRKQFVAFANSGGGFGLDSTVDKLATHLGYKKTQGYDMYKLLVEED